MNLQLFKTKCDACSEPEKLFKKTIKDKDFYFCEECLCGSEGDDPETTRINNEFYEKYGKEL